MTGHGRYFVRRSVPALAALGLTVVSLAAGSRLAAAPELLRPAQTIGMKVSDFRLPDATGRIRTLAEFKDRKAVVVVFTGTACPIANSYAEPLSRMEERYRKSVQFLAVNANPDETRDAVARHAQEYLYSFPVLKDETQAVANELGARVTPEAFVLDADRVVCYRGRIDDSYASRTRKRAEATSPDLQNAIDAVLAGKAVMAPVTQAFGCTIIRPVEGAVNAEVSYHRDVAPVLQEHCQSCHRPGQVAPFPLLSYADAKSWAAEIKEFTASRQMPPWKAEAGHGDFLDVRRMPEEAIRTLGQWVEAGAPEGNPKDGPKPREWAEGRMLGKPDLVLQMPEPFSVESTGRDVFHCFVLPTGLTEDKHVVGVEVRPGNPRVLHHVLNFIDTSGRARQLDEKYPGAGYSTGPGGIGILPAGGLGGWAPGNMPRFLPRGVGRFLPKNSDIVLQVHYHKTGKPETDQTQIGLYFAKEPVQKRLVTFPVTNLRIDIPPGEARHEITRSQPVPADIRVIGITPHMHLLGKEMKVSAKLPDGTVKPMVWIKDWDYRWQDTYVYQEPLVLPRGTVIDLAAYYDNTENNPLNPHSPPKRVTFGEQTTDEMCFAFLDFVMEQEPPGGILGLLGLFSQLRRAQ